MTSSRFDAITLEVLWTRLISVVDEAAKAIVRTSFSTLVQRGQRLRVRAHRRPRPRAGPELGLDPVLHRHAARDGAALPARAGAGAPAAGRRADHQRPRGRGPGT